LLGRNPHEVGRPVVDDEEGTGVQIAEEGADRQRFDGGVQALVLVSRHAASRQASYGAAPGDDRCPARREPRLFPRRRRFANLNGVMPAAVLHRLEQDVQVSLLFLLGFLDGPRSHAEHPAETPIGEDWEPGLG
jgi:hypothetical protein